MEQILVINGLKIYYFTSYGIVKAVDNINMEIGKGEVVGLVGESGCGKSTIALSIMGLTPRPGKVLNSEIIFVGKNLLELNNEEIRQMRGKQIAMIFQDPMTYLNPVLKIGDQIAEALLVHGQSNKKDVKKRVIELMSEVRLPMPKDMAGQYPHQLSGGMRQRVMIAMALSCRPTLLIADEPTTALDVTIQSQILELIRELRDRLKISILLLTHDIGVIAEICDKLYIMYAGKIIENSDIYELFENPKHPYTIGLLNSALSIDSLKKDISGIEGVVPDLINPPTGCSFHPRCSQAMPICNEKEPPLTEIEAEHNVKCWLYV